MIRVVLVDDQALFRAGIRMLIASQPDLEVVGEAGNGQEAIDVVRTTRPDVVMMDIRMPVMDGLTATAEILARPDAPRVVMLTTYDGETVLAQALQAGASGFLLKTLPPEELIGAIRVVARGDSVVDPAMTRRLATRVAASLAPLPTPPEVESLTAREYEVLLLVAEARSNAEIASALVVSEETVKTHVSRILAKLGVRDRIHAVVYAHQHKLVG